MDIILTDGEMHASVAARMPFALGNRTVEFARGLRSGILL